MQLFKNKAQNPTKQEKKNKKWVSNIEKAELGQIRRNQAVVTQVEITKSI